MASVDFRCDSDDLATRLDCYDNDYFTALDAVESTHYITEHSTFEVGQEYIDPTYRIHRGGVCFDTSGLDDACLIVSATLWLKCASDYADEIIIQSGAPIYPRIPGVVGDYNRTHYSGNGGSFTAGISGNTVTLNSDGRDWINKTGYTKFLLRSQAEIDREAPTGDESASFYGNYTSEVSYRPKLTIVYTLPTGEPSVTSVGPCVDRQSTTMTAVGNVTDDGGGYEARGFEYYEDTDNIYESEMYAVRELGVFTGTGDYEMTIYGLKPLTTYQIRAWIRNSFGLVNGDWYTCTTTEVPSYGVYSETNTASYRLYVSDDEAIAWQGYKGPYSGKQTLINITDITNKTKGGKVLKILPDAKGTFHVCVTLKEELKS